MLGLTTLSGPRQSAPSASLGAPRHRLDEGAKAGVEAPQAFDAVMLPAAEAISCFDPSKTCEGGKRMRPVSNHWMSTR